METLLGQFLIAMPSMEDTRFRRSVIFICEHNDKGAMGIVVNKLFTKVSFPEVLAQVKILAREDMASLSQGVQKLPVHHGGPVEGGRGFVLHSPDYFQQKTTERVNASICITATIDILRAMASGKGPERSFLALGYAGWGAGQLESELQNNSWLSGELNTDILFNCPLEDRYETAMKGMGIHPALLSTQAGHA